MLCPGSHGRGRAQGTREGKPVPEPSCYQGECKEGSGEFQVCGDPDLPHALYRARFPGTGMRGGLSLQGRREGIFHRPGRLRYQEGNIHHAGLGSGPGGCGKQAGGRRLRRQGGCIHTAHSSPGSPQGAEAGKGGILQTGILKLPSKAPCNGGHVYPGMRRERYIYRTGL